MTRHQASRFRRSRALLSAFAGGILSACGLVLTPIAVFSPYESGTIHDERKVNDPFVQAIADDFGAMALFAKVVRAHSPPALAPGAMILVGLAGFAWTLAVASGPRRSPNP